MTADAPMVFRRAREEDAGELARMRWDMREEGGETVVARAQAAFLAECARFYRDSLHDPLQLHWVASMGPTIAGTLSLHRVRMIPRPCRFDDAFACITNNYVRPELRNQGIATRLLRHVIAAARAEALELLIVWPSEQAVPFYARSGFAWDNEVMELRLRSFVPIGGVRIEQP